MSDVRWADIEYWSSAPVYEVADLLRTERQRGVDALDELAFLRDRVSSEGRVVDAMKSRVGQISQCLDRQVRDVTELMMAMAQAAAGVAQVEVLVRKARACAVDARVGISAEGVVSDPDF
ncbi:hypothetical protein [Schaalia vaccimaxillae]|uniref:hypothetical protein n=1 Tax=Schaalia vaccimaxillae TaxID=183916 RepID=UPI0003B70A28|nr:hypothetical protein [Schaalia vaccimaxillae]